MLTGVLRQRDGKWYVDASHPANSEPTLITISWLVTGTRRGINYGPAPEMVDGLAVTHSDIGGEYWQAYEHGNYLTLLTEHDGTISEVPLPCPKVRKGIETRYRYGRWEKAVRA